MGSASADPEADVDPEADADHLFLRAAVDRPEVSGRQNGGNISAGWARSPWSGGSGPAAPRAARCGSGADGRGRATVK